MDENQAEQAKDNKGKNFLRQSDRYFRRRAPAKTITKVD
jgi:hypothetical protein